MAEPPTPLPTLDFVADYGGAGFDYANAAAITPSGELVVAVDYRSPDSSNGDVVVLKYSPLGELVWSRVWGGDREDHSLRNTVAVDDEGFIYVGAAMTELESGDRDLGLIKYDPDGQLVWQRVLTGVEGEQRPHAVVVGADGSVFVGGHLDYDGIEGHAHVVLLMNVSPDGEVLWQQGLLGDGSVETAYGGTVDGDGNLIVSGNVGEDGEVDAMLIKLDPNGDVLWQKKWGAPGSPERAWDVVVDAAGNAYMSGPVFGVGNGGDSTFVVKVDADGELMWARTWRLRGNELWGHGAAIRDDVLVVSGFVRRVTYDGVRLNDSGYLLGISPDGELLWQAAVGSPEDESIEGIRFASDGSLFAVGQGERGEQTVVPLFGQFHVSDLGLVDTTLVPVDPGLGLGDLDLDAADAGGVVGGDAGSDAVILRLELP